MTDALREHEKARNLWESFARKHPAFARVVDFDPAPSHGFDGIGGLEAAKDELLTYACAITNPEVYDQWGTHPPSGVLLIGQAGVGKSMLARALAHRTDTSFLRINVPKLVIEVVHGLNAGELMEAWPGFLAEVPPLTVFFDELSFAHAAEIGGPRPELPVGPIIDFLLALVDRTHASKTALLLASTSHPDTLRLGFVSPGRFERVVEVTPVFPVDVIEALQIHAAAAEKRAGRPLFEGVDWSEVVGRQRELSPGQWIRMLHAVLRRKARCQAANEEVGIVSTADLTREVERMQHANVRLPSVGGGNYL